jgi:hypothetical protein
MKAVFTTIYVSQLAFNTRDNSPKCDSMEGPSSYTHLSCRSEQARLQIPKGNMDHHDKANLNEHGASQMNGKILVNSWKPLSLLCALELVIIGNQIFQLCSSQ